MHRSRFAALTAALVLAAPGAASAQSAGDEQYEDPFAPEPGQTEEGGSSGGGDGGSTGGGSAGGGTSGGGTVQPAPTAAPEAAPAPVTTTAAGQELPRTGADTGLIALGGAVLLAGGVALRVTLRERGPRRR